MIWVCASLSAIRLTTEVDDSHVKQYIDCILKRVTTCVNWKIRETSSMGAMCSVTWFNVIMKTVA